MTHNYYLYNNCRVLTWIPWDNNEAFQSGSGQYSSMEVDKMGSGRTFFDSSSSGKSSEFSSAVSTLKTHASSRVSKVEEYLGL